MKYVSSIIFVFFNLFMACGQSEKNEKKNNIDAIYLMIDPSDSLTLIQKDKRVYLFKNRSGLMVKRSKDSIRSGLKSYRNETDENGFIIMKEQPVEEPWIEFNLFAKPKVISSEEYSLLETKNRLEFIRTHSAYSKKYVIVKDNNSDYYKLYSIHLGILE